MKVTLAALVLVVALAPAPAEAKPSATQAATIAVTMKEFRFILSKRAAPKGRVVFKVTNLGVFGHDFSIAGKHTPIVAAGATATLSVMLEPGRYPYSCLVPGHALAGMRGVLVVR